MRSLAFRNAAVPDRLRCLLPRSSAKVRAQPPRLPEWEEFPSLVPETLHEMSEDEELTQLHADVIARGQLALTEKEDTIRREMLDRLGVASFAATCAEAGVTPLRRAPASILQLNIGLYCNQACRHCHVESSPKRTEMMSHEVARRCIELLDSSSTVETLDLTGGAPELCPEFAYLVKEATARGVQVIDRCNLTVLVEPGQEGLAGFLAENKVRVVASLPCYSKENVDSQRGGGVFARSIRGLQMLNEVGYGVPGSGLTLDLVYNPGGVFLAPPSSSLECAYKDELKEAYGITFNSLLCLNNMPIKRWSDELVRMGKLDEYMELLVGAFNPAAAEGLMCRATVSIGWSGEIYDCDFNQQLGLAVSGPARTVFDLGSLDELNDNRIVVASHCWGCTAGNGSGCQGGLDA
jgi:radical SAM/Cys-rich protein